MISFPWSDSEHHFAPTIFFSLVQLRAFHCAHDFFPTMLRTIIYTSELDLNDKQPASFKAGCVVF
jgi:hypothetical protein